MMRGAAAMMRRAFPICVAAAALLASAVQVGAAAPASASSHDGTSNGTLVFGPYVNVGEWNGNCGAIVADLAATRPTSVFRVHPNADGTFDVVRQEHGVPFVTRAGPSFHACDDGVPGTLRAGVTGHETGYLHVTVSGRFDPRGCDGGACVNCDVAFVKLFPGATYVFDSAVFDFEADPGQHLISSHYHIGSRDVGDIRSG
jgi:hypothetical protein